MNDTITSDFTPVFTDREERKAFYWVANIINSCLNSFHLDGANRLMALFEERYGDNELSEELRSLYYEQVIKITIP